MSQVSDVVQNSASTSEELSTQVQMLGNMIGQFNLYEER